MYRLEDWELLDTSGFVSLRVTPRTRECKIGGGVYNHDKYDDGMYITTSLIIAAEDGIVYTKSGSQYLLGQINSRLQSRFPNARSDFFAERPLAKGQTAFDKWVNSHFTKDVLRDYKGVLRETWNASRFLTKNEICGLLADMPPESLDLIQDAVQDQ